MIIILKKGNESLEVDINPDLKIETIQALIKSKFRIAASLQKLSLPDGTELHPSECFSYYNLSSRSEVFVDSAVSKSFITSNRAYSSLSGLSSLSSHSSMANLSPFEKASKIDLDKSQVLKTIKENDLPSLKKIIESFDSISVPDIKKESILEFINKLDDKHWTLVHHSCFYKRETILSYLVSLGCDINGVSLDQYTPLQIASMQNAIECIKVLMITGSLQINKMSNRGSALHVACRHGHEKVVEKLLDAGAHPGLEDSNGLTPILLTQKIEILEMIPKYVGKELINKYCKGTDLPLSFSGMVYWSSPWKIQETQVFLLLNSAAEHLYHYTKRSDFENNYHPSLAIRIRDIEDVRMTEETILESKFFIVIKTKLETYWYYTKYPDMTSAWVQKIVDAVKFFHVSDHKTAQPEFSEPEEGELETIDPAVGSASFFASREVGIGSFGKVYEAFKKDSNERFAIKVLSKAMLRRQNQFKYAIAECKILKEIRHPFIIPLFWAFQTPKNLFIVYEFCPYGDLTNVLKAKGKLSEAEARLYISETILAIEYLHNLKIVYRDLKPLNILLDHKGHVKLSDFGLAKANVSKENLAMSFCGSPAYLAPELLKMSGAHKPVDIYAIGVTLYELLTGTLPYTNDNLSRLYKEISVGNLKFPNEVSKNAKSLIKALMATDPNRRPTISQVKNFDFFEGVDWEHLLNTIETSPFRPSEEFYASIDPFQKNLDDLDFSGPEIGLVQESLY